MILKNPLNAGFFVCLKLIFTDYRIDLTKKASVNPEIIIVRKL